MSFSCLILVLGVLLEYLWILKNLFYPFLNNKPLKTKNSLDFIILFVVLKLGYLLRIGPLTFDVFVLFVLYQVYHKSCPMSEFVRVIVTTKSVRPAIISLTWLIIVYPMISGRVVKGVEFRIKLRIDPCLIWWWKLNCL